MLTCCLSRAELEVLLNQVTLMHVLVTVKELLLKCSLRTALGKYIKKIVGIHSSFSLLYIFFQIHKHTNWGGLKVKPLKHILTLMQTCTGNKFQKH